MEQYATATSSSDQNLFELQLDHEVSNHLSQTAKWAKFLSIVGFVGCGLMLVVILFFGYVASSFSSSPLSYAFGSSGGFAQIFLLIAMAVLYFFPCWFMFNFSNRMLRALRNNDQTTLIASFRSLKLCFKYIGILTLVIISIYVLALLFALIFAASR